MYAARKNLPQTMLQIGNDTFTNLLKILTEINHPYIYAIYQIGSSTLPYLTTHRDTDILLFTNEDSVRTWKTTIRDLRVNHIITEDVHISNLDNKYGLLRWPYLFHYATLLYGQSWNVPDLFQDTIKNNSLQYWIGSVQQHRLYKTLYHLFTLLCFWDYNDYYLTSSDINIINELHNLNHDTDVSITNACIDAIWPWLWATALKCNISNDVILTNDLKLYLTNNTLTKETTVQKLTTILNII